VEVVIEMTVRPVSLSELGIPMQQRNTNAYPVLRLRVGELVEVKSRGDILATLDENGQLDGLPFMPEMLDYCGRTFRVYKRADKTCDTVNRTGARRMENAVHLEDVRCGGAAHGGCQAACMIFWKEAWLTRVGGQSTVSAPGRGRATVPAALANAEATVEMCTENTLLQAACKRVRATAGFEEVFSCQATELPKATSYLAWWDIRQYVRDVHSGNIRVSELAYGAIVALFNMAIRGIRSTLFALRGLAGASSSSSTSGPISTTTSHGAATSPNGRRVSPLKVMLRPARWALERWLVQYPHIEGSLQNTPTGVLNLQPGELIRIKSKDEIVATLNVNSKNRGLSFDAEMVPYCGGTYKVLSRVERIVNERTGRMLKLPNDAIVLDGVICKGCLSSNRLFCPRSTYSYWREIWLQRATQPDEHAEARQQTVSQLV
jgi:hypothetical protein